MAAIIKWSIVVLALSRAVISPVYAGLPDITADELLKAVKHGDSLYRNVDCRYTVDEQLNKAIFEKSGWPLKRKLEIHWRSEEPNEYIDVTMHDGTLILGKPVRCVMAQSSKGREQWFPNENKSDIFNKPCVHAWPVPIDFGMRLYKREKKLGESLAECEIMNIRQEKWQGHECYFIEAIQSNGAKAEVWIDPEIGWRARCVRYWGPDGTIWHEASAEFKDCGNGAWFPVQGVYKLYGNDPNSGERVVSDERKLKVEQVKVNTDLTQKDFEIQYPRGTRVYLFDTGESYIAGVTSVAGFGEEALNPLKDKALPDMKQFAVELDPNQTKDKMILVCFFDMNQRPSRNCMRQLSAKAQELTAKDVVVVAVQASKVDEDKLNDWVKKNNIPFPVGMVQSDEEKTRFAWGVRSLPWLSLTDTQHVVIAEGFYLDELGDKLNGNSQ
jgi:peroxiredoxin